MTSRIQNLAPPGMHLPIALVNVARDAYANPPRHYHTWEHVLRVAGYFRQALEGPGFHQPEATFLAVLAHDAIYDVARRDNEELSAQLAAHWAETHLHPSLGPRAAFLVRATASHHALPVGEDADLDLFLDCDLATLGAGASTYDAYAAGVRAEYLPLAGDGYAAARSAFIASFLEQPHLFRSPWFRQRLEASARSNLRRELASLR